MSMLHMDKEEIVELLEQKDDLILITSDEDEIADDLIQHPNLYSRFAVAENNARRLRAEKRAELDRQIREEYIENNRKQPAKNFVDSEIENNSEFIELDYLRHVCEGITKSFYIRGQSILKAIDLITAGRFNVINSNRGGMKEKVQSKKHDEEVKKLNEKRRTRKRTKGEKE